MASLFLGILCLVGKVGAMHARPSRSIDAAALQFKKVSLMMPPALSGVETGRARSFGQLYKGSIAAYASEESATKIP